MVNMKKISDIYELFGNTPVEVVEEEPVKKSGNKVLKVFAVVGVIVAVVGAAFALYRYFKPDYLEDYEDDFEDEDDELWDEE